MIISTQDMIITVHYLGFWSVIGHFDTNIFESRWHLAWFWGDFKRPVISFCSHAHTLSVAYIFILSCHLFISWILIMLFKIWCQDFDIVLFKVYPIVLMVDLIHISKDWCNFGDFWWWRHDYYFIYLILSFIKLLFLFIWNIHLFYF
jgi:hypothetical protein